MVTWMRTRVHPTKPKSEYIGRLINSLDIVPAPSERPTDAIAYTHFVSFGTKWRPAVKVIPEGHVGMKIIGELEGEGGLSGHAEAASIRKAWVDQRLGL